MQKKILRSRREDEMRKEFKCRDAAMRVVPDQEFAEAAKSARKRLQIK